MDMQSLCEVKTVYSTLSTLNQRKDPPSEQCAATKNTCFLILRTGLETFYPTSFCIRGSTVLNQSCKEVWFLALLGNCVSCTFWVMLLTPPQCVGLDFVSTACNSPWTALYSRQYIQSPRYSNFHGTLLFNCISCYREILSCALWGTGWGKSYCYCCLICICRAFLDHSIGCIFGVLFMLDGNSNNKLESDSSAFPSIPRNSAGCSIFSIVVVKKWFSPTSCPPPLRLQNNMLLTCSPLFPLLCSRLQRRFGQDRDYGLR